MPRRPPSGQNVSDGSDDARARRRRKGPAPIGRETDTTLNAIAARFGFFKPEILKRWADIAGPHLARYARPERISFPKGRRDGGTLFVRVEGAASVEIHHRMRPILERINAFYGYPALAQLKIVSGAVPRPEPIPPLPSIAPDPVVAAAIDAKVGRIKDPALAAALANLGKAAAGRMKKP